MFRERYIRIFKKKNNLKNTYKCPTWRGTIHFHPRNFCCKSGILERLRERETEPLWRAEGQRAPTQTATLGKSTRLRLDSLAHPAHSHLGPGPAHPLLLFGNHHPETEVKADSSNRNYLWCLLTISAALTPHYRVFLYMLNRKNKQNKRKKKKRRSMPFIERILCSKNSCRNRLWVT